MYPIESRTKSLSFIAYSMTVGLFFRKGSARFSDDFLLVVSYNGNVLWVPQLHFTASCPVPSPNAYTQTCSIEFGSWTYNDKQISIDKLADTVDLSNLRQREWQVTSAPVTKETKYYPCCPEPYATIVFTVNIKKRR